MPVAETEGFRCFVCHRDMAAEMSQYDAETDNQTKEPAGRKRGGDRGSGTQPARGAGRDARLGLG